MTNSRNKYHIQASLQYPHVGQLIGGFLNKHTSNIVQVAGQMGVLPTTLRRYSLSESLQLGILWKLSLVANHNFILEIGSQLPIDYPTPGAIKLQHQLEEKQKEVDSLQNGLLDLQRQIEKLNIELAVYKSIVGKSES